MNSLAMNLDPSMVDTMSVDMSSCKRCSTNDLVYVFYYNRICSFLSPLQNLFCSHHQNPCNHEKLTYFRLETPWRICTRIMPQWP